MGLMRRVKSREANAAGVGPMNDSPSESPHVRSDKASKLHVQPAELARKLVKEMEDHKVPRLAHVSVCNRYTVYLCPADYERLREREGQIVAKLEHHLSKHARVKEYEVLGDIKVAIVVDADLKAGRFGILTERADQARADSPVPVMPPSASTKIIPPREAAQLDLAHETIVLKAGERVREFNYGRVIVGRARDVDFRVDDPNVSRRHAAIYWADGRVVVEDLGSTNGTMVNGYPVKNTVLHPNDVVVIGDCRITVETR
jgi:hypothetical protein